MNIRITESPSPYRYLERNTIQEITSFINSEDAKVAEAIRLALPQLNSLIAVIVDKVKQGGRLFYVGAGSGGRLSVLDMIELPTTFGIEKGVFNVVLAGGIDRLADAREEKEDDLEEGWTTLQQAGVNQNDILVGVSASGTTPFVCETLRKGRMAGITTGCIVSNTDSPIAALSDFPVEVITGPEFITGSTRMKCGTAQKMIFDIVSATTMIQLGRVEDNSMVHVALINDKITDRAVRMLLAKSGMDDYDEAKALLLDAGSVKKALLALGITGTGMPER